MPRYLLSIYQPDGPPPPPEVLGPIMADLAKVNAEMQAAGAFVFMGHLAPPDTASVLRLKSGRVVTTDGPFTESKEHIGGFTVIEAADLDEALMWGGKFAAAITLPIEVRPMGSPPEN